MCPISPHGEMSVMGTRLRKSMLDALCGYSRSLSGQGRRETIIFTWINCSRLGLTIMKIKYNPLILIIALCVYSSPGYTQTTLTWSGDLVSTRAFMRDIADIYAAKEHVTIELTTDQTSNSIRSASEGTVDIAGSGRSALPTVIDEHRVKFYPVAWDALVVITHPDNPVKNLSVTQLRDVLNGSINNWSSLGFENAPIHLYSHENSTDSVSHNIRELLLGSAKAKIKAFKTLPSRHDIENRISSDIYGMAITTYSGARRLKVSILALEGVDPRAGTIVSGDYLLYQPLYVVMKENGKNRRLVKKFLRFIQSRNGARVMRRNGIAPYTENLTLVSKQLDREQFLLNALTE